MSTILEHFRQQSFISKRLLLAPGGGGASDGKEARLTGLTTHIFSGDATKRDRALIDKIIDISGKVRALFSVMLLWPRWRMMIDN